MKKQLATAGVVALFALIFVIRVAAIVVDATSTEDEPRIDYDAIAKVAADDFQKRQQAETRKSLEKTNALLNLLENVQKQHRIDAASLWQRAESANIVTETGTIYASTPPKTRYDGSPNNYGAPQLKPPTAGRYIKVSRAPNGLITYSFHQPTCKKTETK